MIRQHKSTHEELTERLSILSSTIDENRTKIEGLKNKKKDLLDEYKKIEEEKNTDIKELTQQIDQMTSNFSKMLTQTLTKMKERIEKANKQWEEENDNKTL